MVLFHYLSRKLMNVLSTLLKHKEPVVAVKNSPIGSNLQRTLLAWL